MSTRSDIISLCGDGMWRRVYCHFDGYLEGVGETLLNHYGDQAKVDSLVKLGDLSSLAENCDGAPGHSYSNRVDGQTVAYHRDRREPWSQVEPSEGSDLSSVWPAPKSWTEYTYVFAPTPGGSNEPSWWVGDPDLGPSSLTPLAMALADPANYAPKPDIKAPWGVIGHRDETRA